MKGNLEMTEPVRLWSGENGSRAAHDWAARPRPPAGAPSPEQEPSPGKAGDAQPGMTSRGRLRAGAAGALAAALLVGGGVVVAT